MIRSRVRALFVLVALLLVAPMVGSAGVTPVLAQDATPVAAEPPGPAPLAEAMPADTAAYVATEFDPGSDQYLGLSALAAKLIIPGAGDTISAIVEQLAALLAKIPSDLRTVLNGEVGAGVSGFGPMSSGTSGDIGNLLGSFLPDYAIVLHPTEAGNARDLVEDWFNDQVTQAGGEVQRTQAGSIVVLRNPGVDTAESSAPAVVAFSGDYILFGADYEALLPYLETLQGNASSLADSEALQELNAALPAERLLYGYVDPQVLLDTGGDLEISSVAISDLDAPFGQTGFTVAAADNGLRIETVSIPLDDRGSLLPLSDETSNPTFPTLVPDSTVALYASQDLGESWAMAQLQKILLTTLVGAMGGGDIDLSDFEIDDQFGFLSMLTGINFKLDLFDQLQGNYGAALFSLDPEDMLGSSAVIASELDDPDRVSVAVTSLGPLIQSSGAGTASVTTASIDGQTVNNVTLTTDVIDATIQYGVVDDQLMVGLGDGIETLASEPADSLANDPTFQAALAELPESYTSLVYVDLQAAADQLSPLIADTLAENSDNAIVQCLAGLEESVAADAGPAGTPDAIAVEEIDASSWLVDTACSVVNGLLGGDSALMDLLISRVPGPLAAVTYTQDGLQHTSGILMVGSIDS